MSDSFDMPCAQLTEKINLIYKKFRIIIDCGMDFFDLRKRPNTYALCAILFFDDKNNVIGSKNIVREINYFLAKKN